MNARDETSLKGLAKMLVPFLSSRQEALAGYIKEGEAEHSLYSQKTKDFWKEKKEATQTLLDIMVNAEKPASELDAAGKSARDDYLQNAKAVWETELRKNLVELNGEIIGPYALGTSVASSSTERRSLLLYRRSDIYC